MITSSIRSVRGNERQLHQAYAIVWAATVGTLALIGTAARASEREGQGSEHAGVQSIQDGDAECRHEATRDRSIQQRTQPDMFQSSEEVLRVIREASAERVAWVSALEKDFKSLIPCERTALLVSLTHDKGLGHYYTNVLIAERLQGVDLTAQQKRRIVTCLLQRLPECDESFDVRVFRRSLLLRAALSVCGMIDDVPETDYLIVSALERVGTDGCFPFACLLERACRREGRVRKLTPRLLSLLSAELADPSDFEIHTQISTRHAAPTLPEVAYRLYDEKEGLIRRQLTIEEFLFLESIVRHEHPSWADTTSESLCKIVCRGGRHVTSAIMREYHDTSVDCIRARLQLLSLAAKTSPTDAAVKEAIWRQLSQLRSPVMLRDAVFSVSFDEHEANRMAREMLRLADIKMRPQYTNCFARLAAGECLCAVGEARQGTFFVASVMREAASYERDFGVTRCLMLPSDGSPALKDEHGLELVTSMLSDDDWRNRYWAASMSGSKSENRKALRPILLYLSQYDNSRFVRAKCQQVLTRDYTPASVGWLSALACQPGFQLNAGESREDEAGGVGSKQ